MTTLTATQARQQFFQIPNKIRERNEEIKISYKTGNFIMIEEVEYENLKEHLHLMKDKILIKRIKDFDKDEFELFSSIEDLDNAISN